MYLLTITKIILITFFIFILIKNKPVIKSIINFNISLYRIKNTNDLL